MPEIEIRIPRPHKAQRQILNERRRFNVVGCGRRWGKTAVGINHVVVADALQGYPVAYFEPTHKMLTDAWREMKRVLAPAIERVSEQYHMLDLVTGGSVTCWSLETPDGCRGRKYKTIVIDEAAMVKKLSDAWNGAIRPTLTDMRGSAWFLSTPRGVNYFHTLYQRGVAGQDDEREDWMSWHMPTVANPFIDPAEIEDARKDTPETFFRQEYLAEFLDLEGAVFRHVNERQDASLWRDEADAGHEYVMGVDWGKLNDWTVVTVIDVKLRAVVHVMRFNQIDYTQQLERLRACYAWFRPSVIKAEANSMGEPLIEQLRDLSLPVLSFTTTNASKQVIIDGLSMAFDRGDITLPDYAPLTAELVAFEATRLPSGTLRYSAPEGMHDDCVMSLALAWSCVEGAESWLEAYGLVQCVHCERAYSGEHGGQRCPYCGKVQSLE